MKLIYNHTSDNHLSSILKELNTAITVKMAIAFLKNSGLILLKPTLDSALKRGAHIEFHCGLNFGTTEGSALQDILNLFEKYAHAKLYMIYPKSNQTFHPKLWRFKSQNHTSILVGSANFTSGGFDKNFEFSLISSFKNDDEQVIKALSYFEELKRKNISREADSLMIAQYSVYQKREARKQKHLISSPPTPEEVNYDFEKLKKWHDKLKHQFIDYDIKRETIYKNAKKVLKVIANKSLLKNEFITEYEKLVGGVGVPAMWKSGSVNRHKGKIYENKAAFIKLVKFIGDNRNADASFVYNNARKLGDKIPGVGPNIICEIMMTYNPSDFANINKNPISVLIKEAKVDIKKTSTCYSGEDYKTYCAIIKVIRKDLNLNDMLEVDTFFNEIYQIIIKKSKS